MVQRIYSILVCASVLFLIFLGALVKSHEAGLSVPDWPTSYGYSMYGLPLEFWRGGIFFEHLHRIIASIVGLLIVIQFIWLVLVKAARSLRSLSMTASIAVVVQGLLGGLTVLWGLPDAVSILHGVLAQVIFVLTLLIAFEIWTAKISRDSNVSSTISSALAHMAWVLPIGIFIQLILGAWMRHGEAGLALPVFPLLGIGTTNIFDANFIAKINELRNSHGLPGVTTMQIIAHLAHRIFGYLLAISVVMVWVRRCQEFASVAASLFRLTAAFMLFQVLMGIGIIVSFRDPWVTSVHVVNGALILGFSVLWSKAVLTLGNLK